MAEGCPASVCLGLDLRMCVSTCVCKTLCTSVHVSVHVSARGYRSICLCEYVPLVCVYARVCAGCLFVIGVLPYIPEATTSLGIPEFFPGEGCLQDALPWAISLSLPLGRYLEGRSGGPVFTHCPLPRRRILG